MIIRSPHPEIAVPDIALTPYILRHAERLAVKPALIDGLSGRTLTYGEFARQFAVLLPDFLTVGSARAMYSPSMPRTASSMRSRSMRSHGSAA